MRTAISAGYCEARAASEGVMKQALITVLVLGTLYLAPSGYSQERRPCSSDHHPQTVSLIRLIASRTDCDGELIRVVGYLAGAGLDDAPGLFVSESDGRNGVLPNAIGVNVSQSTVSQSTIKDMMGKYVIVTGRYHAPGAGGAFNGSIDHMVEVRLLNARNTSK